MQNPEEAAQAVAATRYPPQGVRGVSAVNHNNAYGGVTDYFKFANDVTGVIVQIETGKAAAQLEAIAAVPGVDAIFIGPGDPAASLGHLGNIQHPDVQEVVRDVGRRAAAAGISAGIVTSTPADVERYFSWGFHFVTVSNDMRIFKVGMSELVKGLAHLRA